MGATNPFPVMGGPRDGTAGGNEVLRRLRPLGGGGGAALASEGNILILGSNKKFDTP